MHETLPLLELIDFPSLNRGALETLQVNLGYRCNQRCLHCHVNAGPTRTEMMTEEHLALIPKVLAARNIAQLDLTGGAPELHPGFRDLVSEATAMGVKVIDRCNLTILFEPGQEGLAEFLADFSLFVLTDHLPDDHDPSHRNLRPKSGKKQSRNEVHRDFRHIWGTKKEKSRKYDIQDYKSSKKEKGYESQYTRPMTMPPTAWPTRSPTARRNGVYVYVVKAKKGGKGSKGNKSMGKYKGKQKGNHKGNHRWRGKTKETEISMIASNGGGSIVQVVSPSSMTSRVPSAAPSSIPSFPPTSSPAPSSSPSRVPSSIPTIEGTSSGTVTTTVTNTNA